MTTTPKPSQSPSPGSPAAAPGGPAPQRETSTGAEGAPPPSRRDWLGLAVLAIGLGLIVLDGTIVGVAMPTIIGELGLRLTDAQWVNSLYAVLLAALLLPTGNLADRLGRKRMFIVGLAVFVGGSVWAAAASSGRLLISSRAVQALGAALIMPSTLSTVNAVFRGPFRAAAFGVWGAVISGAAAIGPLAGGALTQWISWRWIFLVNLPLGLVLIVAALMVVPETRSDMKRRGVDVDGALLAGTGLGSLVFAIIEGPELGWWTPKRDVSLLGLTWPATTAVSIVTVALVVSAVALALFVVWERHRARVGRSALLDLQLFTLASFSWGNLTAATVAVGEFALLFVLPLFLVNVLGLSVMSAGLVLAAMAFGAFLSGAAARHLAARFGAPGTVAIGLGLEVSGVLALALILRASTPGWMIALPLVAYGLGLGLASAQLTGTVLRDVPVHLSGQGSAAQSTVRQIGAALGTAFAGAVLSAALRISLPGALSSEGLTGSAADALAESTRLSAGTTIARLRAQGSNGPLGADTTRAVDALTTGFADAARISILVAAVFLLLGLVSAVRPTASAVKSQ